MVERVKLNRCFTVELTMVWFAADRHSVWTWRTWPAWLG